MKKIIVLLLSMVSAIVSYAGVNLSSVKGVWASDDAEAVITDDVCIFFLSADNKMQAMLEIPAWNYFHKTVFEKDGTISSSKLQEPLPLEMDNGDLCIAGKWLKKVEDIEIVSPYDMMECKDARDVGKCLQEWRLGSRYRLDDEQPYCEINTNRHMFIYMLSPSMIYIRAAATRNNDNGTLFFQNIRMMKNLNTGEFTMKIMPSNFDIACGDMEIDNSKFNPMACTFSPDGGIYWSLISFAPDIIFLNGCGETYQVAHPGKEAPINEWIKYKPYSQINELYGPGI